LTTALSLQNIVDVVVYISPIYPARSTFNHGLIIGTSTKGATPQPVIPTSQRVRQYTNTAAMLTDGFTTSSPEYIAAQLYFSQSPAPTVLWVGCQNTTAATPETPLVAFTACRAANNDWYAGMVCGSTDSDNEAIAAYAQTAVPSTTHFFTTSDTNIITPPATPTDIFTTLAGLKYNRSIGIYSTQSLYACAALMGVAMGLNTGLANSAYTLKFKALVGVTAEPSITPTQVYNAELNYGNVYVNYAGGYTIVEQGTVTNGQFYDEIINLDMLTNNIQLNVMNLLISNEKIPLTDPGITQILNVINTACDQAVNIGFLAPGIWNGVQILNLQPGNPVPKGYLTQAPSVNTLTTAQRTARQAPPIYVAVTEAGAVHSVLIGVYVQR